MRRRRAAGLLIGTALIGAATVAPLAPTAAEASAVAELSAARGGPEAARGGPEARAEHLVATMSTAEQAASVIMGHIPGTDAGALHDYMAQGLGGFILMGANIPATDAELAGLTDALVVDPDLPPLIAIDEEGGIVARLPDDDFAASTVLKSSPTEATADAFLGRASLVARAGITVNFGTVADVTADSASFIYGRALGTDPQGAADRVAAATEAQEGFLASTLKHFPGHGAAPGDSHHVIPSTGETLDQWRERDAVPFVAGIESGASLVMFGHLAYTSVDAAPASLSPRWHEILRDDLGFEGVAVTDDLGMLQSSGIAEYADPVATAVAALGAGNDLVLMIAGSTAATAGDLIAGITAAVDAGTLPADRLAEAATRVLSLRLRLSAAQADWSLCPACAPAS